MSGKRIAQLLLDPKSVDLEKVPAGKYEFADPGADLERVNMKSLDLQNNPEASWFHEFNGPEKVAKESLAQFKKGNTLLKKGKHLEALKCYTLSAAHAGENKDRLAFAYEKRGLCFMEMEFFNCAIVEFTRALQLMKQNHPERELIQKRKEEAEKVAPPYDFKYHEDTPSFGKKRQHLEIQSARNCIEIYEDDEQKKPRVRAKAFIAAGEVVSVERPYACALWNDVQSNREYNCHHCFELCLNMIPCPSCPDALYCSEECLEEAFNKYHQFECVINPQLYAYNIAVNHSLAMRTAITGRDEYDEILDEGASSTHSTEGHRSDRLKEIIYMKESSQPKLCWNDYKIAAHVHKILKEHTTFFRSEWHENQFKKIYMHLIRIYSSKCCEIRETLNITDGRVKLSMLGSGFYPFNTLFDHSCVPNLLRVFYGNAAVLVVIKDINPGDKCTVGYGGAVFTEADLPYRKALLKFLFDIVCTCIACKNDWPTMERFREQEVGKKYKRFDILYGKLIRKLEEEPDAETAKEVMQITCEEFQPVTSNSVFNYSYRLSIICNLFLGNSNPRVTVDE